MKFTPGIMAIPKVVALTLIPIVLSGGTPFGDMTTFGNLASAFNGVTNAAGAGSAVKSYNNTGDGYVGTTLPAAKRIGQAMAYGTNNNGFVATVNSSTTLSLYGKLGSNPANSTDGTLLATLNITDTANESAGRTITVTDTGTYDRVWLRITHVDATNRAVGVAELQLWELA